MHPQTYAILPLPGSILIIRRYNVDFAYSEKAKTLQKQILIITQKLSTNSKRKPGSRVYGTFFCQTMSMAGA
jgi:hypothetical protein